MCKFTIITPQYNSFHLMDEYFKSLENQTFKDFEVIIVDDCSTDDSYYKLVEYAEKSKLNIRIFRTENNSGPGNARNVGLDNVKGDWITFIDNDDWVVDNFLEEIDLIISSQKVNSIIYDYYGYLNGHLSINHSMYVPIEGVKTAAECVISVRNHTIGKFYKFSDCKDIRFPTIRRCEDVAYVSQALALCGNAYYLMKPLYFYRQRATSLSNQSKLDETGMLQAFKILEEKLGSKFSIELMQKSVCDLLYGVLLMKLKAKKSKKDIENYIIEYEKKYPNWEQSPIINYLGTPKKLFLTFVKYRFILGLRVLTKLHSFIISKGS